MAFNHASAPFRQRDKEALSADNSPFGSLPERHIVIDIVRKAAPLLGLKPPVIATLDAMLSCLPPKRTHHTVFASNETLAFRRDGISDRTIRRHAAELLAAGLLIRQDSPNRKRFARRKEGAALRFGFDLSPLFHRFEELNRLAAVAQREQEELDYFRCKLRTAVNNRLNLCPEDGEAMEIQKLLRRKLSAVQIKALLLRLDNVTAEGNQDIEGTRDMAANDGQNVRHHQNSNKEPKEKATESSKTTETDLSISEVVHACPDAAQFLSKPIQTLQDIIRHAHLLAPMLGIEDNCYSRAVAQKGQVLTALTVWAIVQMHAQISNTAAYFQSLTYGRRAGGFDPIALLKTLSRKQSMIPDCPRTTELTTQLAYP